MLENVEKTISIASLIRNMDRVIRDVGDSKVIYRITRGNRSPMMLVDEEYLRSWLALVEDMQRPDWPSDWQKEERDIAEGRLQELDSVLRALRRDRRAHAHRSDVARRPTRARTRKGRGGTARSRRSTS